MNPLAELLKRLEDDSGTEYALPLDINAEEPLCALLRRGLNELGPLKLHNCRWAGLELPGLDEATVDSDGTLRLEAMLPNAQSTVPEPINWKRDIFTADAVGHGLLTIEDSQGGCRITPTSGDHVRVRLYGWRWSALSVARQPGLWATPVQFSGAQRFTGLRADHGNMLLAVDGDLVRGWRFASPKGPVYFVPTGDTWYLAQLSEGELADFDAIPLVNAAIGFVLGIPFELGVFQQTDASGCVSGLIQLGARPNPQAAGAAGRRQTAAIPFGTHPCWAAEFVDAIIDLGSFSDAPIVRCINLFFASQDGFLESQFLHAWMALETLSRWALDSGRVRDGGDLRLADHAKWIRWVRSNTDAIAAMAVPGKEQSLLSRVESAECDRPTKVQRVFKGLGIDWTAAMADAEQVRHGVAHEGSIPSGRIEATRDLGRIGLVGTMFTSLLAHLAGYVGPISDRSRTCFNITETCEPTWRTLPRVLNRIEYHGRGTQEVSEANRAKLRDLVERAP